MGHSFDIHALDRELRAAGFATEMVFADDETWWMGVGSKEGVVAGTAIEVLEDGHVELTMMIEKMGSSDWDAIRIVDRHINGFPPLHPLSNIVGQIEAQEWGTVSRFLSTISLPENVEQALSALQERMTK